MTEQLYGRHAVLECLRANRRTTHRLMLAEGVKDAPILREITSLAQARRIPVAAVPRQTLDAISDHHQGVAMLADRHDATGQAHQEQEAHAIGGPVRSPRAAACS